MYVNELNHDAMESYLVNRDSEYPHLRNPKFHSEDIKSCINEAYFKTLKLNLKQEFGSSEVDLICGGPPCQGFSGIGIRRSYSVDKKQLPSNHLYQDMAYVVQQLQPKIFLFENVAALLRAKWTSTGAKGEIFDDILRTFKAIKGYKVMWKLLYSKDYGVPQNRPRIILVGVQKDISNSLLESDDAIEAGFLPKAEGGYPHLEEIFSDIVDKNFEYGGETLSYPFDPKTHWQAEMRTTPSGKILKKDAAMTEQKYSNHAQRTQDKFQAMIDNHGKIPEEYKTKKFAQRLLPKKWGNKGPTITVTSLPDDFVHYSQARAPTVRECARMQTFPDWYQFAGNRTTGGIRRAGNPRANIFNREAPKFTQIGNAVPVLLGEALGRHFKSLL